MAVAACFAADAFAARPAGVAVVAVGASPSLTPPLAFAYKHNTSQENLNLVLARKNSNRKENLGEKKEEVNGVTFGTWPEKSHLTPTVELSVDIHG